MKMGTLVLCVVKGCWSGDLQKTVLATLTRPVLRVQRAR